MILLHKKIVERACDCYYAGAFSEPEATGRGVRCVQGSGFAPLATLALYWLVDLEDGVIVDARFNAFGPIMLIAAADIACELSMRKTYDQAGRISSELIDKTVRDKGQNAAFPPEAAPYINCVLDALEGAAEQCRDISLPAGYVTPIQMFAENEGGYPGWIDLPLEKKLSVVEQVLDRDIRPYIELDAGGVQIVRLTPELELYIAYQGSCTSCYASVGSTLSYIQQIIQAKVHPTIKVIPSL